MSKMEFTEWLDAQLKINDMNRADLARASSISPSQITRIMNGEQGLSPETIVQIARAIKRTPEDVFRRVVGITASPERTQTNDEVNFLLSLLPEDKQKMVIDYIRYTVQMETSRNKR